MCRSKPNTPVDRIFHRTHNKIILQPWHFSIGMLTKDRMRFIQIQLTNSSPPSINPQMIITVYQYAIHIIGKNRCRAMRGESVMLHCFRFWVHLIKSSLNRTNPQISLFIFRHSTDLRCAPCRKFPGNIP